MNPTQHALLSILCLGFACVLEAESRTAPPFVPLGERTPAYFVDQYGLAKSSRTVSQHAFFSPEGSVISVKGEFSVREFRAEGLRVRTVFHLPSLKLAEVMLRLERVTWTDEQVEAALTAYGREWKLSEKNVGKRIWTAPDGARAILLLTSLHIQPAHAVEFVEKARQEWDAKRKAVPKF
jgi:hypothetical protein